MGGLPIPSAIGEVTPAWLTEALRSTDVLADGAVASVVPRRIGNRASYTGEDYRLATLDRFVQSVLMATHLRHGNRGDHAMAQALTERFVAASLDLRLAELL